MNAIDQKITDILAIDGRISFAALGREIGLSTNATAARVRRLENDGAILGYRAILSDLTPSSAPRRGTTLEAFVDVRLRPDQDSDAFLALARNEPCVRDAVHVTGPYDYLLHVHVEDTAQLDTLLRRLKRSAGAGQTQTRLALRATAG
ncbi:Lrp/AsnC family leucine-responsive transcriptional regulator [Isoptericola halotolerans]|uniref:Lrp/AsnC family leucine-responsive transcriptional regulator n=1 Tax=Isoptericola halotolerans TaxID=300560 RepID=A0ABX2A121_9MICO|nr:Lrp/AsnC family leucine-responsive transcriptional regulator [Isoptericola halotolerans]